MKLCTVLDMTPDEVRQALADWKRNAAQRDELVRAAQQAGIPIKEIGDLTGLSRTTIYGILDRAEDQQT